MANQRGIKTHNSDSSEDKPQDSEVIDSVLSAEDFPIEHLTSESTNSVVTGDPWSELIQSKISRICIASWPSLDAAMCLGPCNFMGSNSYHLLKIMENDATKIPFRNYVHPADLHSTMKQLQELRTTVQHLRIGPFRLVMRDDINVEKTIVHYKWIEVTIAKMIDSGDNEMVHALFEDVDHYKRRADQVEKLLHGTRLGRWEWNEQLKQISFDELWASMLGYALNELDQTLEAIDALIHPEDVANSRLMFNEFLGGTDEYYENVLRMKHCAGHWVHILDRAIVIDRGMDGKILVVAGTHTDISKEKIAQQKAIDAVKTKNLFLASMSHEIRTPLNGVIGVIDLIKRLPNISDETRSYLKVVDKCSDDSLAILSDILDMCKMEAGSMKIENHTFDIRKFIDRTVSLFKENAYRVGVSLVVKWSNDEGIIPMSIKSDQVRIGQILSNLISNAIKFTENSGTVTITMSGRHCAPLTQQNSPLLINDTTTTTTTSEFQQQNQQTTNYELIISVQDTGMGIGEDHQKRIFRAFEQADSTITRTHGGTGLGLAIVDRLCKLMGGSVTMMSEIGLGSTFTCIIRVYSEQQNDFNDIANNGNNVDSDGNPVTKKNSTDFSWPNVRVLVAEDNRVNQMIITRHLKLLNIIPHVVGNGQLAVEAYQLAQQQNQPYDIIFMDMHMPVIGGIEASERIFECVNPVYDAPTIIAITADAFEDTREACRRAGIFLFVPKPFRHVDIREIIEVIKVQRLKMN